MSYLRRVSMATVLMFLRKGITPPPSLSLSLSTGYDRFQPDIRAEDVMPHHQCVSMETIVTFVRKRLEKALPMRLFPNKEQAKVAKILP